MIKIKLTKDAILDVFFCDSFRLYLIFFHFSLSINDGIVVVDNNRSKIIELVLRDQYFGMLMDLRCLHEIREERLIIKKASRLLTEK